MKGEALGREEKGEMGDWGNRSITFLKNNLKKIGEG